jgi:DNA replication regulator DPB11
MMAESALLERALRVHGGVIVPENAWREGQKTDYLVVRLCVCPLGAALRLATRAGDSDSDVLTRRGSGKRPDLSNIPEDERPTVVTECWVEGCCFEERLLPLNKDMVFTPLAIPLPVPGADRVGVHMSGFPPEKVVYLKRLIKVLGESRVRVRAWAPIACADAIAAARIRAHEE